MNRVLVRKKAMKLLISAATIYLVIMFLMAVFQRRLMYYPYPIDERYEFPVFAESQEELWITCDDGVRINGIYAPPRKAGLPVVLMFHGNAGNLMHRDFLVQEFNRIGCGVCIIDYHGYGKSGGRPSEKNLYRDGRAVIAWLQEQKQVTPAQTILFGKSLGSGVAVEMGTAFTFKGIILETPFASAASVAFHHYPYLPVGLLMIDRYDNRQKIGSITCPLLIVHGTADRIVPTGESRKLFEKANEPRELYLVDDAGHNDVQFQDPTAYWQHIETWIRALPGVPPAEVETEEE